MKTEVTSSRSSIKMKHSELMRRCDRLRLPRWHSAAFTSSMILKVSIDWETRLVICNHKVIITMIVSGTKTQTNTRIYPQCRTPNHIRAQTSQFKLKVLWTITKASKMDHQRAQVLLKSQLMSIIRFTDKARWWEASRDWCMLGVNVCS